MAATGTPTPNIGLRIPQGTDPASVDDINYNSNLLDTKLGAVGNTSVQDQIDSLNSNMTEYASATATSGADGSATVSYPTGYSSTNCILLGAKYTTSDNRKGTRIINGGVSYYANTIYIEAGSLENSKEYKFIFMRNSLISSL